MTRVAVVSIILFTCGTLSFLRGFLNLTPQFTKAADAQVRDSDVMVGWLELVWVSGRQMGVF